MMFSAVWLRPFICFVVIVEKYVGNLALVWWWSFSCMDCDLPLVWWWWCIIMMVTLHQLMVILIKYDGNLVLVWLWSCTCIMVMFYVDNVAPLLWWPGTGVVGILHQNGWWLWMCVNVMLHLYIRWCGRDINICCTLLFTVPWGLKQLLPQL